MSRSYLTTEQLSGLIHYDTRTIRDRLKDSVLLEGVHYIRPLGGRKLLFIWKAIEKDIANFSMGRRDRGQSTVPPRFRGRPLRPGPARRPSVALTCCCGKPGVRVQSPQEPLGIQ